MDNSHSSSRLDETFVTAPSSAGDNDDATLVGDSGSGNGSIPQPNFDESVVASSTINNSSAMMMMTAALGDQTTLGAAQQKAASGQKKPQQQQNVLPPHLMQTPEAGGAPQPKPQFDTVVRRPKYGAGIASLTGVVNENNNGNGNMSIATNGGDGGGNNLEKGKIGVEEELELCKLKLKAAMAVIDRVGPFLQKCKENGGFMLGTSGGIPPTAAGTPMDPNSASMTMTMTMFQQQNGGGKNGLAQSQNQQLLVDQLEQAQRERDALRKEIHELEGGYSALFKRYEKLRDDCALVRDANEQLQGQVDEGQTRYEALVQRFHDLRDHAAAELERANVEVERQAKAHDEATLSLRFRVRKLESELQTQGMTLTGKDAQIAELNSLCEELMRKLDVVHGSGSVDGMSVSFSASGVDDE